LIRVLNYLTTLDLGGKEATIMNFYRNMDRSKVQFDFVLTNNEKNESPNKHYFEDEAISMGARIFRVPIKSFSPMKDRNFIKAFTKIFKENKDIKIFHIHTEQPLPALILVLVAMKCGVKARIVHSRSTGFADGFKQKLSHPFLRIFTTHLRACSREAGHVMFGKKAWDRSKKSLVLHNARDIDLFRFNPVTRARVRDELGLNDEFTIITVARLAEVKNISFAIEAFNLLLEKKPNCAFVIVGDGELRGNLQQQAVELGIEKSVLFLGMRMDVANLLQAGDVCVMPSLYEGLPGVAIEGQAAGLPCLLSDTISAETKITDNVKFLPINQGAGIWADAMFELTNFNREDTFEAVQKAGYEINEAAKKLEDFYLKVLK